MSVTIDAPQTQFALDVAEGLSGRQKKIAPRYFYDDLGSTLFEAITLLPEYGLTRADQRLLTQFSSEIVGKVGDLSLIAELGSGSGKKTRHILEALALHNSPLFYFPIDVSAAALEMCDRELSDVCQVKTVCADWVDGLAQLSRSRYGDQPLLLLFLGSSIGNLDRECIVDFLRSLTLYLRPNDFLLLGADLVKDIEVMLAAYDDPTGVTAAFNLNLLGRMNRELGGDFDLRSFAHEVQWNPDARRIEMHLLSGREQSVFVHALEREFHFSAGETIWTESSHKFTVPELDEYARSSGFEPLAVWTDRDWAFAENLWRVS